MTLPRQTITAPDALLAALHTSDITDDCLHRVRLRHEGKADPEIGTALFRGDFAHEALGLLHKMPVSSWCPAAVQKVCRESIGLTDKKVESEGRVVSKAARDGAAAMYGEIEHLLKSYIARIGPELKGCKIIAVEAPIEVTIDVDDEPAYFRSHLDLIFRDERGTLHVWDWKSGTDAPSFDFLARNHQLALYWLAAVQGEIRTGPGEWLRFNEAPTVAWIHLNHLKPFGRKTKLIEDGVEVEYVKGDTRPINKIVRQVEYRNIDLIIDALIERVRMVRHGFFPKNPEQVRCCLCECRHSCASFVDHPDMERG